MMYKTISWWRDAFHVWDGETRIGIVNRRIIRINGVPDRIRWFAHNEHFFTIKGEFTSRTAAAEAIPTGPIHQPIGAFTPALSQHWDPGA